MNIIDRKRNYYWNFWNIGIYVYQPFHWLSRQRKLKNNVLPLASDHVLKKVKAFPNAFYPNFQENFTL